MIVIGTDTHKASHTAAAREWRDGRVLADRTVRAKRRSFEDLLRWARRLGGERVWALEDCRHVSGALERFLLARGERVVRVAPKLTAGARDSARERGKSMRSTRSRSPGRRSAQGLETLPVAQLAGIELDIRLLVDHRERLVGTRTRLINDLRWHLHDLWPELEIPTGGLIAVHWPAASRRPPRPHRADRAGQDRARRAAPHPRAHPHHQRARSANSRRSSPRPRQQLLAERGCGVLDRRQTRRRDRRHPPLRDRRQARTDRRISTDPRLLRKHDPLPPRPRRQPPNQLPPCTASHSAKASTTPTPPPTSPANKPKAKPTAKPALPQTPPRPPRLAPPPTPDAPPHALTHQPPRSTATPPTTASP